MIWWPIVLMENIVNDGHYYWQWTMINVMPMKTNEVTMIIRWKKNMKKMNNEEERNGCVCNEMNSRNGSQWKWRWRRNDNAIIQKMIMKKWTIENMYCQRKW